MVNAQTGLAPDYAEFNGAPSGSGHQEFRFDAWRVISNIAVDFQWWKANGWAVEESRRLLTFFRAQGIANYGNQFNLTGSSLSGDHSPGLVSMNALAALALPAPEGQDFVQELWNLTPPSGRYRYYDGMLYFLALLHASGRFVPYGI